MSKANVKAHPVWKVLARDQALLNDYVDYIFAEGKQRFGNDNAMGVYPSSCGGKTPEMRAWYVYRLGIGSDAIGRLGLFYDCGRLVGIAPEALGAPGKGVEKIVVPNKKVLSVGQVLEETCQTSAYAPDQIKKLQNILEEKGYIITQR